MSRFGMDSLMLIIALTAGCVAVMRENMAAGVVLSVFLGSAMVRTMIQIARSEDERMSTFDKMIAFFVSVAIVLLIVISALFALMISTFFLHWFHPHPFVNVVVGVGTVVGAGYAARQLVRDLLRQ